MELVLSKPLNEYVQVFGGYKVWKFGRASGTVYKPGNGLVYHDQHGPNENGTQVCGGGVYLCKWNEMTISLEYSVDDGANIDWVVVDTHGRRLSWPRKYTR